MTIHKLITNYLSNGGLFNPEFTENEKVRDLLMDCDNRIAALEAALKVAREALESGTSEPVGDGGYITEYDSDLVSKALAAISKVEGKQ